MKCDTTNAVLTFVLGVLVVAGVIFALQTINHTREFRALTNAAAQDQGFVFQAQALASDVTAYNQKTPNPELTKVLQTIQARPAAH